MMEGSSAQQGELPQPPPHCASVSPESSLMTLRNGGSVFLPRSCNIHNVIKEVTGNWGLCYRISLTKFC